MDALQAVESRRREFDPSLADLLREDDSFGPLTVNLSHLRGVRLRPLTLCDDPMELGYVKKLLELGGVPQLMAERCNMASLDHQRARRVKTHLKYTKLARRLQDCTDRIKGPLQICLVWSLRVGNGNGHSRTMLAVVFHQKGDSPYGYYFHLKSALWLCGLRF
jgi:hypothetical protein